MRRPFLPFFYWNRIYFQHILATYTHSVSIEHTDTQYYCTFPLCMSPRIYVYVRFAFILTYVLIPNNFPIYPLLQKPSYLAQI
jgi:hypothetical protein